MALGADPAALSALTRAPALTVAAAPAAGKAWARVPTLAALVAKSLGVVLVLVFAATVPVAAEPMLLVVQAQVRAEGLPEVGGTAMVVATATAELATAARVVAMELLSALAQEALPTVAVVVASKAMVLETLAEVVLRP